MIVLFYHHSGLELEIGGAGGASLLEVLHCACCLVGRVGVVEGRYDDSVSHGTLLLLNSLHAARMLLATLVTFTLGGTHLFDLVGDLAGFHIGHLPNELLDGLYVLLHLISQLRFVDDDQRGFGGIE